MEQMMKLFLFVVLLLTTSHHCCATTIPWYERKCPRRPPAPPRHLSPDLATVAALQNISDFLDTTLAPCTATWPNNNHLAQTMTAASAAIIIGGRTHFFNLGCVDKSAATKTKPTKDTKYRLASVSKTFAVDGLIHALRDGKLTSADDEARKLAPDFVVANPFSDAGGSSTSPAVPGSGAQPTWKQMASQLSGLPDVPPCPIVDPSGAFCNLTTAEALANVKRWTRLLVPPNTIPSYSNLAYALIGDLIAERAYNKPYDTFLRDKILAGLDMHSTGMVTPDTPPGSIVNSYLSNGEPAPLTPLGFQGPSGGMYSTSHDMLNWADHYLREWRSNEPFRREFMQPVFQNGDASTGFGTPWEIWTTRTDLGGYQVRTKSGSLPGVLSHIALIPELDLGFVLLWNGQGRDGPSTVTQILESWVLPQLLETYAQIEAANFPPLKTSFAQDFVGLYDGPFGMVVTVSSEKNSAGVTVPTMQSGQGGVVFQLRADPSGNASLYQLTLPSRAVANCMALEFMAQIGQWCHFTFSNNNNNNNGNASSTTTTTLLPNKQSAQVFCPGTWFHPFPRKIEDSTTELPPSDSTTAAPTTTVVPTQTTAVPAPTTTASPSQHPSSNNTAADAGMVKKSTVVAAGAGAGVGGLVLGVVIGYFFAKKKPEDGRTQYVAVNEANLEERQSFS